MYRAKGEVCGLVFSFLFYGGPRYQTQVLAQLGRCFTCGGILLAPGGRYFKGGVMKVLNFDKTSFEGDLNIYE